MVGLGGRGTTCSCVSRDGLMSCPLGVVGSTDPSLPSLLARTSSGRRGRGCKMGGARIHQLGPLRRQSIIR